MMVNVAINGFGRIGRQILQAGINDPDIKWVAINDLTDTKTLAYLLKYDSVQRRETRDVAASPDSIVVNGKKILVFAEKDPEKLPWKNLGIDVVIESSGFFTEKDGAMKHIKAGAKKVLISAPSKSADLSIVRGVNEHMLKKEHTIVSNCSCTTNCAAPMTKVLNDNFGIEKAFMVTSHAYTATQRLVDAPDAKDPRRGRSAAINMVPSTTGAAEAVVQTIPELKGKLDGFAIRVPVPSGSIITLIALVKKPATKENINWLFNQVAQHHMKGVLEYTEEPLVSTDIIHNSHSCILDAALTKVTDGNLVSVTGWYDNEWGYSCRMVDVVKLMG
ncbi:MAG TPA: type I glyceraldehyde-3-phosphate dehydrogenase [Candidatus Nanoarchaeia archaeon]|nr:type I glyceraldehyde-3-phosphate dehydrogenase [Candidatus Nanoarchaeia archaeon]